MKKSYFLLFFFCFSAGLTVNAQAPDDYYDSALGKKGRELQYALSQIIDDHFVLDFGSTDATRYMDVTPDNYVYDIYSYPCCHILPTATGTGTTSQCEVVPAPPRNVRCTVLSIFSARIGSIRISRTVVPTTIHFLSAPTCTMFSPPTTTSIRVITTTLPTAKCISLARFRRTEPAGGMPITPPATLRCRGSSFLSRPMSSKVMWLAPYYIFQSAI